MPSPMAVTTRSQEGRPEGTTFNNPSSSIKYDLGKRRASKAATNAEVDLKLFE